MNFALANVKTLQGECAALVLESGYFRVGEAARGLAGASVRAMLDDWSGTYRQLLDAADACARIGADSPAFIDRDAFTLLTPIRFPNKLVCVGAVYRDHLREFNLPAERWKNMPMFLRAPTTSIVGPGRTLVIPRTTRQFDWEIELAVVIGARLKDADEEAARAGIAGYSIGLDMTCRDLLDRGSSTGVDLVRAKAQDGMAPIGPFMRPAEFVGDPQRLRLRLYVNEELKQDGSTSDMLFPVYEQVSTISHYITLEPGDVVFTGSPAGSGASIGQFLKPGDQIRAEIDRIGRLDIEVVEPVRNGHGVS